MLIVAYHSGDMLQPMTNGQFSLEDCNSTSREYSDKAENNTKEIYKLNVRKFNEKNDSCYVFTHQITYYSSCNLLKYPSTNFIGHLYN